MKPRKDALVVDASVAVKLFLPEELADRAEQIFSLMDADDPSVIFVPELFFLECANVFRSRCKLRAMKPDEAKAALEILHSLPLQSLSMKELSGMALDLALEHDLSVYDACYLAAAAYIKGTLVTADRKLVRKLIGSEHHVIWLGEW